MKSDLHSGHKPQGTVNLPPSKSIANRLLIFSSLSGAVPPFEFESTPDDIGVLQEFILNPKSVVNVGLAGTAARFLIARLAVLPGVHVLTGEGRLLERPMDALITALRELGADIRCLERAGYLPVEIHGGKITGGQIMLPGNISSQFLSALLMVAPYFTTGLRLNVIPPFYSRPYVEMTVSLMRIAGAEVDSFENGYSVAPGNYTRIPHQIESDWSAAAFFYELIAVSGGGSLLLKGLKKNSVQGDSACVHFFEALGVRSEYVDEGVKIFMHDAVEIPDHIQLDCRDFPDLVQSFMCTCFALGIRAKFTGVRSLRIKETDRLAALKKELGKLGANISYAEDRIEILSFGELKDCSIETYEDHRMAMSFAPLTIRYPQIIINNPKVVSKSFPLFWTEFNRVLKPDAPNSTG